MDYFTYFHQDITLITYLSYLGSLTYQVVKQNNELDIYNIFISTVLKLNENKLPYYETLNGRSLAGKEVLSGFDTLTVDGTALNKIDFFDSDDKEKSIGGTIMKSAAAIAPMFMGPVGTAYSVV